jgi:hypothetical protein
VLLTGVERPDLEAAEREAAMAAAAIAHDLLPRRIAHEVSVDVRTGPGQRVLRGFLKGSVRSQFPGLVGTRGRMH